MAVYALRNMGNERKRICEVEGRVEYQSKWDSVEEPYLSLHYNQYLYMILINDTVNFCTIKL